MQNTLFLAQFIGIFTIILGLSMLIRRKMVTHIIHEIAQSRSTMYLLGLLEFVAGLLLVLYHNIWGSTLSGFISFLGWLVLIEGVLYLFIRRETIRRLFAYIHSTKVYYFIALVYLLIGVILAYQGFTL